jgi:hypothetical protein
MPDDKSKRGRADRNKVAGGEAYEVDYVAKKLGVTAEQVKSAIKKVGNDRAKVEAELRKK